MASFTCRTCLLDVASLAAETGVCEGCTLREQVKTISADNPTGSFHGNPPKHHDHADKSSANPPVNKPVAIPPGYVDAKFIDEGGMGKVFRVLELSTGRTVAIKLLHSHRMTDDMLARFSVEAKALAALKHPNLVFLYEFNERADPPYLVMEYVDGVTAYQHILNNRPINIRQAVSIIHQAAIGIHAAHLHNVIHRDIKPSNILIDQQGVVKLTDFGLAKRLHEKDDLTIHGNIAGGTPGYMAPEQIKTKLGEVGVASDVWALGATLYCLLAGQPPYLSNKDDMLDVLSNDHKPVRFYRKEVSPVLDAIVQKCLMFEPAERYPSAEALANDLDSYLNNRPTVVRPPSFAGRLWNTARNLQTATVVAWCLALLMLTIIGASFFSKPAILTDESLRKAYYKECRNQLEKGFPVTLIGPDGAGPPKHVEWPLEDYVFSKPYASLLGATHLTAKQNCFAELLDDPGIDSYILRGEFLHLGAAMIDTAKFNGATPIDSVVGLGFGLHKLKRASGLESDNFMTFTYQDGWPFVHPNATKTMHYAKLVVHDVRHGENFNGSSYKSTIQFAEMEYQPTERPKQLWRTLEVRITPDDLMPSMTVTNGEVGTMHNKYPTSRSKQYLQVVKTNMSRLPQFPNDSYNNLAWNPKRPVGIWCQHSTVAVRNVQIIPIE